ncbi:TolC family protein [Gemmata sp.]|uniref:TolC family protein n=1 Tax=Gemmata sp. TaxID=1914242 RepID=UPI003F71F47F
MRRIVKAVLLASLSGGLGCTGVKSYLDRELPPPPADPLGHRVPGQKPHVARRTDPVGAVVQASAEVPADPQHTQPLSRVDEFVGFAVAQNPRIGRATIAIDAAQGRFVQAGLYPNPELAASYDEIGDRTGPGILSVPRLTQTIVTGKKLKLSQAVAAREVDQAALGLLGERYAVAAAVRADFYQALALQQRIGVLAELARLADESVENGRVLLKAQKIAKLDLIQIEIERERIQTDLHSVEKELPAAYRRLAATAGNSALPIAAVAGSLDGLPDYDLEATRVAVLATHPDVRTAKVGIDRAQAAVRRAEAEPIPNVTVLGGFVRQFENKSYDGTAALSMPLPVWNRNQGNIREAKAELARAALNVTQVENELADRVATAFQTYAAARERAERYRTELIPRAEETFKLSLDAFKGGQFEYLRVIEAQRTMAELRLERNRALSEAWKAAAELSGLLLEEAWPPAPPAPPMKPPEPPKP